MGDKKLLTIEELKDTNGNSGNSSYLIMQLINHIELLQKQIDKMKDIQVEQDRRIRRLNWT